MIGVFLYFIRTPLKLAILAIGLMAVYAYATGGDMNVVVTGFIDKLIPIKDAICDALQALIPMLLEQVTQFFKGVK